MLRHEELAFIKANSKTKHSPVFLQDLRKAVAAGKKKKALVASNANTMSDSALEHHNGVGDETRTSRDSPQLHVSKRKAEELSSSDCPSKSVNCCPAPGASAR
jgi:hypothetical protein